MHQRMREYRAADFILPDLNRHGIIFVRYCLYGRMAIRPFDKYWQGVLPYAPTKGPNAPT